ncbi:MAG: hypothetical protein JXQ99_05195, partial [Hyphomicrobiaceae bacterium]
TSKSSCNTGTIHTGPFTISVGLTFRSMVLPAPHRQQRGTMATMIKLRTFSALHQQASRDYANAIEVILASQMNGLNSNDWAYLRLFGNR